MRPRRQRIPPEVGGTDLSPDVLAIRDVRQRLERVRCLVPAARREGVLGVVAVRIPAGQVEDGRGVREGIYRTGEGVVVVGDPAVVDGADQVRADAQRDSAPQGDVRVQSERLALRARIDHGPVVLLGHPIQVKPCGLGAAARAHARLIGEVMLPVELFLGVVERSGIQSVRGVHQPSGARGVGDVRPDGLERRGLTRELSRAWEPKGSVGAEALRDVELRLPDAAAPRVDDDHAVRGAGPVDRSGRCGSLQNLDRLDIVRDEVGQPVGAVVLVARDAGTDVAVAGRGNGVRSRLDLRVAHDHAIHDVQRLAIAEDGGHAADLNLAATARRPAVHVDQGAWHLALQCLLRCLCRDGVQLVARQDRDRRRRVAALQSCGLASHDDGFESQHVALQSEVDARLFSRDPRFPAFVPDRPSGQRHGGRRNRYPKLPPLIGLRRLNAADHRDGGERHRFARRGVDHLPRDNAILRWRDRRSAEGQQRHRRPRTSGHNNLQDGQEPWDGLCVPASQPSRCGGARAGMQFTELACILSGDVRKEFLT